MSDVAGNPPPEIAPASTSVTAFVGPALAGPLDEPVACASFADFERDLRGRSASTPLGQVVRLFFANGGTQAQAVVRVAPDAVGGELSHLLGDRDAATGIHALRAVECNLLNLAPSEPTAPASALAEAARFCPSVALPLGDLTGAADSSQGR